MYKNILNISILLTVEHYLSSSNYMDCISSVTGSNGCNLSTSMKGSDLPELFSKLGLGKYTDVFQQQEVLSQKNKKYILKNYYPREICRIFRYQA